MVFLRILYIPYFIVYSIIAVFGGLINLIIYYAIWLITNHEIDLNEKFLPKLLLFDKKICDFLKK